MKPLVIGKSRDVPAGATFLPSPRLNVSPGAGREAAFTGLPVPIHLALRLLRTKYVGDDDKFGALLIKEADCRSVSSRRVG
jgi:hypothetical protein